MEFTTDITPMDDIFFRCFTKSDDCESFDAITLDNESFYSVDFTINYTTK